MINYYGEGMKKLLGERRGKYAVREEGATEEERGTRRWVENIFSNAETAKTKRIKVGESTEGLKGSRAREERAGNGEQKPR